MKTKHRALIIYTVATIFALIGSYVDYENHAVERGHVEVVK